MVIELYMRGKKNTQSLFTYPHAEINVIEVNRQVVLIKSADSVKNFAAHCHAGTRDR